MPEDIEKIGPGGITPVEQRTIFRTIGIVRPDQVPGSA
jgi:hypothetical protein